MMHWFVCCYFKLSAEHNNCNFNTKPNEWNILRKNSTHGKHSLQGCHATKLKQWHQHFRVVGFTEKLESNYNTTQCHTQIDSNINICPSRSAIHIFHCTSRKSILKLSLLFFLGLSSGHCPRDINNQNIMFLPSCHLSCMCSLLQFTDLERNLKNLRCSMN
jgi:hypothetical protein